MQAFDFAALPALSRGSHKSPNDGMCIMEAVAFIAGEPFSDKPACVCPVIGAFMRTWNDGLPDDERDALLRPMISRLIGTRGSGALERRRALMAADWLVRVHTPAWLRLAGLTTQAEAVAGLPEITDTAQGLSLMPTLEVVRKEAAAAGAAAVDAAGDKAGSTAWATAWAATRTAAWAATRDAAGAAAVDAAGAAAVDAAWAAAGAAAVDAAWNAAGAAAWNAACDALNGTRLELQQSALALVERMIAARDSSASV